MAGSKFDLNIMQNLETIKKMVEQGATDISVAKACGVHHSTWIAYIKRGKEAQAKDDNGEKLTAKEKDFLKFYKAYAHARKAPDQVVEASLLLSCQDRTLDETITIKRFDPEGKLIWTEEKTRKVPVPASVPAQQFYLANRKRKDWEYKPDTKVTVDAKSDQKAIVLVEREKEQK